MVPAAQLKAKTAKIGKPQPPGREAGEIGGREDAEDEDGNGDDEDELGERLVVGVARAAFVQPTK